MFGIECRYEYWGPSGITWTKWYIMLKDKYGTKDEAEKEIESLSQSEKNKKLKHEYRIIA